MREKKLCFIRSDWEFGAGKPGTANGPKMILEAYQKKHGELFDGVPVYELPINLEIASQVSNDPHLKNANGLLYHTKLLAHIVRDRLTEGNRCIILSADHSNGIGGLSGLCQCVPSDEIGVIWIDAHLDLHSPFTSPSGNSHGMALNVLLGDDNFNCKKQLPSIESLNNWEELKAMKGNAVIPGDNIVFIGTRDYEPEEWTLVKKHNILTISPSLCNTKGIKNCIETVLQHLSHCKYLYVSFDVDSLDPSISDATGTPVNGGLNIDQGKMLIDAFASDERTQCLEITEFNPSLPHPAEMLQAIESLLDIALPI